MNEDRQAKIADTNQQKKLTRVVPSVKMINEFVKGAKAPEPVVTH